MNRWDESARREHPMRQMWRVLVRNRALVLGTTGACLALVGWYTWRATPVYEASVSVRIDEKQPALPMLEMLATLSTGSEIGTEMEELASRTLAEEVVRDLRLQVQIVQPRRNLRSALLEDLEVDADAPPARYLLDRLEAGRFLVRDDSSGVEIAELVLGQPARLPGVTFTLSSAAARQDEIMLDVAAFEDAVQTLRKSIRVDRAAREANMVFVHYRASDPELVRHVPNALAARFIERRQHVMQTEARSTGSFLREQLDRIASQLSEAEESLRSYRELQRVYSPEVEATTQLTRLVALQTERTALEAERGALSSLLTEVRTDAANQRPGEPSPYRRLIGFPPILRNQAASELLRSVVQVENERAVLLSRRTMDDPDVRILTTRVEELERELRNVSEAYLQGLTNHVAALDAPLAQYGAQLSQLPAREVEFARRAREAKVLEEIYVLMQTRLRESEIAQAVEDPSVRVVDPAIQPRRPIRPNPATNMAAAMVMGLALGLAGALLREMGDRSIRTREDVISLTGHPILGLIPRIRFDRGNPLALNALRRVRVQLHGGKPALEPPPRKALGPGGNGTTRPSVALAVGSGRDAGLADAAYSRLHTNINFSRPGAEIRVVLMTSAQPGDGKTTSSVNFALTLARGGSRVLLIDGDLHRGSVHALFDCPRRPGLSDVLLRKHTLDEAISTVDVGRGRTVEILPTGTLPPNPRELLGSPRMGELLSHLRDDYDLIVIDTPPINAVTDAALLSAVVDGVILVARAGVTPAEALNLASEQLAQVHAPVLGTLLNDVDTARDSYYDSAYQYYGSDRYTVDLGVDRNADGEPVEGEIARG